MSSDDIPDNKVATVKWLEGRPALNLGTTFGLPWRRGEHSSQTVFTCVPANGSAPIPLSTRVIGYWPDGSVKFTSHDIPANKSVADHYQVYATSRPDLNYPSLLQYDTSLQPGQPRISVQSSEESLEVNTGAVTVSFAKFGPIIVRTLSTAQGSVIGENGHLVLWSQFGPPDEGPIKPRDASDFGTQYPWEEFQSKVSQTEIEQESAVRVVVKVTGNHHATGSGVDREPWIPFVIRFYLYAESDTIRLVHSLVYNGNAECAFIRGIGLRFEVPFHGAPLYDRHVRVAGVDDGVFGEAVQGVTGLWRDPGAQVREAQIEGTPTPPFETWESDFTPLLKWVPTWSDFTLSQLSPDGFTFKKRTKAPRSWVKIPGGNRAGGLVYLGSAQNGGLAFGVRHFWERYPTSIDVRDAVENTGQITLWLYSPAAEPLDMRPYHDGLGQMSYEDQLDAMKITYEDWEPGLGSPYGIARTNEFFIFGVESTPSSEHFSRLTSHLRNPPLLVASPDHLHQTSALGDYWSPAPALSTSSGFGMTDTIEQRLDMLYRFYQKQIDQRRWYGFWDHGDVMHTYDSDRHMWRYDIGGYAWDNSELSPDLWLWLYFLRTGRADVYRTAEALTRHTSEVDMYHIGPFKGLGTRHGVQHWSDSCKQARVTNSLYRRVFYFLSGGDERMGQILDETLAAERSILALDPYRKVRKDKENYTPRPEALEISLGTDWSALAASWFVEWERRGLGWIEAKRKLYNSIASIAELKNGFVTGLVLYDVSSGKVSPPASDPENTGVVKVSHLSAMFGLVEICAELFVCLGDELPRGFGLAWLEYCQYFNASDREQLARFGVTFGKLILRQGHSRLTAYASTRLSDSSLAKRAWSEFYTGDGYSPTLPWKSEIVDSSQAMITVEEASWVSTNITSLYGLAAIQNLAWIGNPVAPP